MGAVAAASDITYADVVFRSVEVDAGRFGANAMSAANTHPGKYLSYRSEISGDQDWLAILDRCTHATFDQTEIRFAACRGISANPNFTIKDFDVSNCGAYGMKGRSIKDSEVSNCGFYCTK